jgi:hypothetical protein
MNSYLRMASLGAALLWAAAVLVIAQPVQAAMVTTNFYSNTLNDSSYLDVLVPGSPTYLITGSFSFEFDETRTEPNNGPQFPVFSFTMDIGGSLFGAEYFAVYAAQPNVFSGVFLSGPSGSNPQQPIQLPYFWDNVFDELEWRHWCPRHPPKIQPHNRRGDTRKQADFFSVHRPFRSHQRFCFSSLRLRL